MRIDETDLREHSAVVNMSFDTLPTDLYDKITSHLVGYQVRGRRRPIALGKVLSLVCKSLQPIGQALVWREFTLDFSELAKAPIEVLTNFEAYQHLHPLVLKVTADNENVPSAVKAAKVLRVALKILRCCPNLDWFYIDLPSRTKPALARQLFAEAAQSASLAHLGLPGVAIELTPATVKLLHLGFPNLISLALSVTMPRQGIDPSALSSAYPDKQVNVLRRLKLEVVEIDRETLQIPQLLCILASAVGAFMLIECDFYGSMFHSLTFHWLTFDCIYVRDLTFITQLDHLYESLPDLVGWFPKLGRLLTMSINGQFTEDHSEISLKSPVSLTRFLGSVPFSIHLVTLKGVHFYGSLSWPETRRKPSELALISGPTVQFYVKTSHSSSQIFVTLKKMNDRKGRLRWHRVLEVSRKPRTGFYG